MTQESGFESTSGRGKSFSLLRKYAVDTGSVSHRGEEAGAEADSSPSIEEGKNGGAMPSLPHTFHGMVLN
jgi:hypothetical protein